MVSFKATVLVLGTLAGIIAGHMPGVDAKPAAPPPPPPPPPPAGATADDAATVNAGGVASPTNEEVVSGSDASEAVAAAAAAEAAAAEAAAAEAGAAEAAAEEGEEGEEEAAEAVAGDDAEARELESQIANEESELERAVEQAQRDDVVPEVQEIRDLYEALFKIDADLVRTHTCWSSRVLPSRNCCYMCCHCLCRKRQPRKV